MTDRELMQQVLEALEDVGGEWGFTSQRTLPKRMSVIEALHTRLAQSEQEPVAWKDKTYGNLHHQNFGNSIPLYATPQPPAQPQMQPCAGRNCGSTNPNLHSAECFEDYEKATGMAQPEKEPVAWGVIASNTGKMCQVELDFAEVEEISPKWVVPLYTTPSQRKPLTDEEIEREWQFLHDEEGNPPDHHDFARAIETTLKEKNT